jgi:protoporphyrinogen oxidase
MNNMVIVGGGIAGLLTAILLGKKGMRVTLIEGENECGGLLRSYTNPEGVVFDYGTHFIRESGLPELDEILYSDLESKGWEALEAIRPGNFFQKLLYTESQIINATYLAQEVYQRGFVELLHTEPILKPVPNLKIYLEQYYGKTFTDEIFAPLMRKLLGQSLESLHQDAHRLFGYDKIIAAGPRASKELKKSEFYNGKIGFAADSERPSKLRNYYPRERGIGLWVAQLVEQAKSLGVQFKLNRKVTRVILNGTNVCSLELDNGKVVECNWLFWTIAPALLLKANGFPFSGSPPLMRKMTLHHYVVDKPFLINNHYIMCNDPELKSFRITLYPNASSQPQAPYSCTVEVMTDDNENREELNIKVFQELKLMGIVAVDARAMYREVQSINTGFPILTNQYMENLSQQLEMIKSHIHNINLFGKASGASFFMYDVLMDIYNTLKDFRSSN